MNKKLIKLTDKIIRGKYISLKEAKEIYLDNKMSLFDILWAANKIRERFKKGRVELCSIVNAKSGNCSQDCRFCAQSAHHKTDITKYPLISEAKIIKAALSAAKNKATCFGIVTSGKGISRPREISIIRNAVKAIKKKVPFLKCSVSLGAIDKNFILELKRAGIDRFHHNLETSKRYFGRMCTTHNYQDRVDAVTRAQKAGMKICSGGIFGIGERRLDRLSLAFALKDLEVESVPLNFLHPVKGTPLERSRPMPVDEILRTIAIFRLILPKADIKICGGRVVNLRSLQGMIFFAGASGMMIGNYLTQPGQDPAVDLQMIEDLGLRVK